MKLISFCVTTLWPIAQKCYGYPKYMLIIQITVEFTYMHLKYHLLKCTVNWLAWFFCHFARNVRNKEHNTAQPRAACWVTWQKVSKSQWPGLQLSLQIEPQHVLNVLRTPFRPGSIHTLALIQYLSHFFKRGHQCPIGCCRVKTKSLTCDIIYSYSSFFYNIKFGYLFLRTSRGAPETINGTRGFRGAHFGNRCSRR